MISRFAIAALLLGCVYGATAQYQQYVSQFGGKDKQHTDASHTPSDQHAGLAAEPQDYQQYMKQYTGGQQGQQSGADYQKYQKQYAGDYQKYQKQGGDYQKYQKQYAGDYQKYQKQGGDYQKYMKQYAGDSQGDNHTSMNQSALGDKYRKEYAGPYEKYMNANKSQYAQKYRDQYAGQYEKYSHEEKRDEAAPAHISNCTTGGELCAWLTAQLDQIHAYVPKPYQDQPTTKVSQAFRAQLARIADAHNGTAPHIDCSDKLAPPKPTRAPAKEETDKVVEKPVEKVDVTPTFPAPETLSKTITVPAEKPFASSVEKSSTEIVQTKLGASLQPQSALLVCVSFAASGALLALLAVKLRADRRVNNDDAGFALLV